MKKLGNISQSSCSLSLYFSRLDWITFGFNLSHFVNIIENDIEF